MADRIDAILVKLGQASGPAALKRWLDNLQRQGRGASRRPRLAERAASTGTIELGSRDLELQDIAPEPGSR